MIKDINDYNKKLKEKNLDYTVSPNNTYSYNREQPIMLQHKCIDGKYRDRVIPKAKYMLETSKNKSCPFCDFIKKLNNDYNGEYTLVDFENENKFLEDREHSNIIIKHNCEKCNNTISTVNYKTLTTKYKQNKCKICSSLNKRLSNNDVINKIKEIHGENFSILNIEHKNDENNKLRIYVTLRHNCDICNNYEYTTRYDNILTCGCPKCNDLIQESKMVKFAKNYLNINEEDTEIKFESCMHKRKLPFDIKYNDILIEIDGQQHFRPWNNNSYDELEKQHKRDSIKTQYCIDNNLTHIRIPYTEENNLEFIMNSIIDGSYISNKNIYIIQEGNLINNLDYYDYLDVKYNE